MNNKKDITYVFVKLLDYIQVVFLVLKMAGLIDWSLLYVFAPAIILFGMALITSIVLLISVACVRMFKKVKEK